MKKLLLFILGGRRILWGFCPWCNSDAPEIDTCPVCESWCGDFPPSKDIKKLWWIRYSARIQLQHVLKKENLKQPKDPTPAEPLLSKTPYFSTASMPAMEKLIQEYVIPGLKQYQILHGFYPPNEARFLRKMFLRPQGLPEDEWNEVLKRVGEEIKKLDESQR